MSKEPKFEVVQSKNDIAECDYIVCVPVAEGEPLKFPDNVMDFCSSCGVKVQMRPDLPLGPKFICYTCMKKMADEELAKGEEVVHWISKKSLFEALAYFARKRLN